jgi:hypothetical protein
VASMPPGSLALVSTGPGEGWGPKFSGALKKPVPRSSNLLFQPLPLNTPQGCFPNSSAHRTQGLRV